MFFEKLLFIFVGVVYMTTQATSEVDYRQLIRPGLRAAQVPSTCPGNNAMFICKNCRELKYCSRNDPEKPVEQHLQTCNSSQTCVSGICSTDPNSDCMPYTSVPFTCLQAGLFPDPADCTKYYICTGEKEGLKAYQQECEVGQYQKYGFDLHSLSCSTPLAANRCHGNVVPLCRSLGQSGALENPTFYYTCIMIDGALYPILRRCLHGRMYSTHDGCGPIDEPMAS